MAVEGQGAGRCFWLERSGRARLARLACLLVLLGVALFGVFWRPLVCGNAGVVDPGCVYRSAQPAGNLERMLDAYHPASVLNLRGGSEDDAWFAAEVSATQKLGIDFYNVPMSATRRPTRRELLDLLDVFDSCRYPLLIHCKSGSDRTGLASGLYLMAKRGVPPEQAIRAFTLSYGHIPLWGPEHLHEPFDEYRAWLAARGLSHSAERLRAWVEKEYLPLDLPELTAQREQGPQARPLERKPLPR